MKLKVNLYGHPLAGLYWENDAKSRILKCGFIRVEGWECLYKHPKKGLFLSVYVDDFKMAGPTESLPGVWSELRSEIAMDDPAPFGLLSNANSQGRQDKSSSWSTTSKGT